MITCGTLHFPINLVIVVLKTAKPERRQAIEEKKHGIYVSPLSRTCQGNQELFVRLGLERPSFGYGKRLRASLCVEGGAAALLFL